MELLRFGNIALVLNFQGLRGLETVIPSTKYSYSNLEIQAIRIYEQSYFITPNSFFPYLTPKLRQGAS